MNLSDLLSRASIGGYIAVAVGCADHFFATRPWGGDTDLLLVAAGLGMFGVGAAFGAGNKAAAATAAATVAAMTKAP